MPSETCSSWLSSHGKVLSLLSQPLGMNYQGLEDVPGPFLWVAGGSTGCLNIRVLVAYSPAVADAQRQAARE
jgi:hypothetical protein